MIKIERLAAIYLPISLVVIHFLNMPKETLLFLILILFLMEYNDLKKQYMYNICFFIIVFMLALPYEFSKVLLAMAIICIPIIYYQLYYMDEIIICSTETILKTIPVLSVYLFKIHLWWLALILAVVYFYFKMDYRLYVGCAIVLLMACAYILTIEPESYANRIAIIAYYMLVLGTLGALLEYLRENETTNDSEDEAIHYERRE